MVESAIPVVIVAREELSHHRPLRGVLVNHPSCCVLDPFRLGIAVWANARGEARWVIPPRHDPLGLTQRPAKDL